MSKNKFINDNLLSKTNIAIVCMIAMVAGFLFSRAMLSMGMIGFGIIALWNIHPKHWLQQKWWLLGMLWVAMYALTFFWCEDKAYWGRHIEVKLPIMLLPLAFAFIPKFSIKQLTWFTIASAALLMGGVIYSLAPLIGNVDYYAEQYNISHTLPTPAENDHIRFSLCIDLFFIWCAYLWPKFQNKTVKWFIACCMVAFSVYLHLLAARTGLMLWYLFVVLWALYIGLRKNIALGIGLVVLLFATAIITVTYVPTLNNRFYYQIYSYERYEAGDKTGNYSDIGRLISYDIALKLIKQHPVLGVSTGDMMAKMKNGYKQWYPEVAEERQLLPHNQFLIVCLACGVPALLLFIAWVFAPLRLLKKNRDGFFFFTIWLSVLLPLFFEPMLEIQFGLFVYLFFLLLQKHMLIHESENKGAKQS
ncbi:MAG: hypothetical protein EOP51_09530 [Sphingobacteriales bacterium]|nr:MAG: hypothetical protein EOP51_09530 [Sphingobacteriales bacterium]